MPSSFIISSVICSAVVFRPVGKVIVHLVPSFSVYTHSVIARERRTDYIVTGYIATGCIVTGYIATGYIVTGYIATGCIVTGYIVTHFRCNAFLHSYVAVLLRNSDEYCKQRPYKGMLELAAE